MWASHTENSMHSRFSLVSIRLFRRERKALLTGAAFQGECFLGVPQSLGAAISSLSSEIGTEGRNKFAPS